jgi:hypothetical protein
LPYSRAQLASLLAGQNQSPSAAQVSPANSTSTTPTVPPTVTINGDNPAIIDMGATYADLGATVSDAGTGQAGDTNLGLKTFLNGALVSNIVLDTSQVATDTMTRVVLVEAASSTAQ